MESTTTTPSKPSGLPRPSRLPILRSKSSQIFVESVKLPVDLAKSILGTPRLQKRPSHQLLPRATPNGPKDISATTTATTTSTRASGPRPATRPLLSSRTSSTRPTSRGNQQRIPPQPSSKSHKPEDSENHDQLSSLDSVRTAPRQDFHDNPVSSPDEYQEPAMFPEDEELFLPKDRSKARPSLSYRTIESLQHLPSTPG